PLQRFLNLFSSAQVRPILYDDYARSPESILQETCEFLGVGNNWKPNISTRHNVSLFPRWPRLRAAVPQIRHASSMLPPALAARARRWWRRPNPPSLTADERAKAIAFYRDDVENLSAILKRDLSHWLDPKSPST